MESACIEQSELINKLAVSEDVIPLMGSPWLSSGHGDQSKTKLASMMPHNILTT